GLASLDIRALVAIPGAYLAGTSAGIFRTDDGGDNWTAVTTTTATGLYNLTISGIAPDPLAAAHFFVATRGGGVFETLDDGANWTQLVSGLPDLDITALVYSRPATTLYAAVSNRGVYKSVDNGANWTATALASSEVLAMALDSASADRCYASTPTGLLITNDGGMTWNPPLGTAPTDNRVISLRLDPADNTRLLAGGYSGGVFLSVDADTNENFDTVVTGIESADIHTIAADPNTVDRYFTGGGYNLTGGTGIGFWYSTNNGQAWANTQATPFSGDNVRAIITNTGTNDDLYAAVNGTGVWYSNNTGGDTWTLVWTPTATDVISLALVDGTGPDTLIAGTDTAGAYLTTDSGATWTPIADIPATASVRDFAVDPVNNQIIYAATDGGVYSTTDGGTNWTAASTLPTFPLGAGTSSSTLCVLVDPQDSTIVYAGTAGGGVFKSTDSGDTFAAANLFIGGSANVHITDLTAQTASPYYVYAVGNTGVFRTEDMAVEWRPVLDDSTAFTEIPEASILVGQCLALDPTNENVLWVGTGGRGVLQITLP
ncbi:MAG: WD40/YVTN/BNR-like repeat-containing protein, partial [Planctomycetota bacterium]